MTEGDPIPDVAVLGADGAALRLRDLSLPLVIWFYPKDDTAGCTHEAQAFSARAGEFANLGVGLLGISRDTVASHARFTARHALAVPLASDADGSVTSAFGVWGEKTLYGRTYMGIERATFLIDSAGQLARAWRKVRVPGHVDAVLEAARRL